jgi:NAD(P)-dependent dehydrogenase (short-subunit alcohol dehydrogenase family)
MYLTTDCERMAVAAIAAHGGINVLCCNAGIMPASKLSDMQESEIDSILGTNIKGTIFAVQACTAALSASGHGRLGLPHTFITQLCVHSIFIGLSSQAASPDRLRAFPAGVTMAPARSCCRFRRLRHCIFVLHHPASSRSSIPLHYMFLSCFLEQAAQLGFMRTAALELCNKACSPHTFVVRPLLTRVFTPFQGITVNAVLPGNITTEGASSAPIFL